MSTSTISAGQNLSYVFINDGNVEDVYGVASNPMVSGGYIYVESGGLTSGATVDSAYNSLGSFNGYEYVENGGVAIGTTVNANSYIYVSGGGKSIGTTVNGGDIYIESNGITNGTTVNGGGYEGIQNGGKAIDTTVNVGGYEDVLSGGTAIGTTVTETGYYFSGNQYVETGGVASSTIMNGGQEQVYGVTVGTIINSGSEEVYGGVTSGSIINSGGEEYVSAGVASGTTVNSGGDEKIIYGDVTGTTVNNGGLVYLFYGTLENLTLHSGAVIDFTQINATSAIENGSNQLIILSGSTVVAQPISLNNSGLTFSTKSDGNSGTDIIVTAVSTPTPTLSSADYNAATGQLTLTGSNLTTSTSSYTVPDLTLKGDGSGSYTLTGSSTIIGTPTAGIVNIQLSSADQLAIDGLLNKNGATANDGKTAYNLSAAAGWDGKAGAGATAVSVSNVTAPTISTVTYNAASGVFSVIGSHLDNHGSSNGITLSNFKVTAGSSSYSFSTTNDSVGNLSANGFSISLSTADKTTLNALVNHNGTATNSGVAYNLTATANWDSDNGAAISKQAITASNVQTAATPTLTSVDYNAGTGQLTLLGSNLTSSAAGWAINDFTLKGDGSSSYTLSSNSDITGTPSSTAISIQLSAADQLAIDGLLNKNGTTANDGKTAYNLSAAASWDTNANAITSLGIAVTNVTAPTITSLAYNATSGEFSFVGTNLDNHGNSNGINLNDFSLSGGSTVYTFSGNDTVSNLTANSFNVILSIADQVKVNTIINDNGKVAANGSTYNVTASVDWNSDSGSAIKTLGITVSGGVTAKAPTVLSSQQTSDSDYLFNTNPSGHNAISINNLLENTQQIELSKAV